MRAIVTACMAIVATVFVSPPSVPGAPLLRAQVSTITLTHWADAVPLALPPGHPPVDGAFALPPGHPPIAGPLPLPPGHPPIGECPARGRADADDDEETFVPIPHAVARGRAGAVDL